MESGIVQILSEYIAHHAETAKEIRKLEATLDMTISCSKVGDLHRVLVKSCGCQSSKMLCFVQALKDDWEV